MKYLLDTNVVSHLVRRNKAVTARYETHIAECALPSVVWHELQFGVLEMKAGPFKQQVLGFYQTLELPILPYDRKAAEHHARERVRLVSSKCGADGQIAAIAVTQELVLVTANVRDFKGFRGIQLEDWSRTR